jgi:hypothetical protein
VDGLDPAGSSEGEQIMSRQPWQVGRAHAQRAVLPKSELIVQAACRGSDPALYDPSATQAGRLGRIEQDRIAQAIAICDRCPIVEHCLGWGQESRSDGVWGGHYLANGRIKS